MAATPERRPFWRRGAGFELSLPLRPEALSLEKIAVQSLQYAPFLRWPLQESEDHFAWGDRRFESPSLQRRVRCEPVSRGNSPSYVERSRGFPRVWGGIIGLLLAAAHPDRVASLVLCNTPTRIPDHIKRTYALDHATASDAMRAIGVGAWCRETLGNRLDRTHASEALCDWVVREMDRTRPDIAAAMHDCFESVDVNPLLPGIKPPVLLLSGDNSPIASAQQKMLAETLPNGRIELFAGYGHGVNLLQPERCARTAVEFWRSIV